MFDTSLSVPASRSYFCIALAAQVGSGRGSPKPFARNFRSSLPISAATAPRDDEDERALRQISEIATTIASAVNCGEYVGAMRRFVDYWGGDGSWDGLPNPQRIALATRINKVTLDFWATLNDPTRLDDLADLAVPTLIVSGGRSPFPTRRICFHLARTMPDAKLRMIDEAGHMLPSSHFKEIAPLIRFHCGARNHLRSEPETVLRARVCA